MATYIMSCGQTAWRRNTNYRAAIWIVLTYDAVRFLRLNRGNGKARYHRLFRLI